MGSDTYVYLFLGLIGCLIPVRCSGFVCGRMCTGRQVGVIGVFIPRMLECRFDYTTMDGDGAGDSEEKHQTKEGVSSHLLT